MTAEPWFSWELEGSRASLLGTGVTVEGFLLVLDLVVSFRHEGEESMELWDGDAFAKKPRILCCFLAAEDETELWLLDKEGVFLAGVRESPILKNPFNLLPRRQDTDWEVIGV